MGKRFSAVLMKFAKVMDMRYASLRLAHSNAVHSPASSSAAVSQALMTALSHAARHISYPLLLRISITTVLILAMAASAHAGYSWQLTKATHNGRIFNFETWDANLLWHATFFSDGFRKDFEDRFAEKNHMDALEEAEFVGEQDRRQANGWEFFISFYTKKDYKKFTLEPDSFWKIEITTADGSVLKPDEIEAIAITPYERVMYPHLTRWSKAYRVTFPKVELGDEFSLTIESVIGQSTLTWKDWEMRGEIRRKGK